MVTHAILFSRRYRAALLDYLLGAGEAGLTRAYELGRRAAEDGVGLLPILQAHQRAINSVLSSTPSVTDALGRLQAAEMFLLEALSPFELTYRGYMAMLGTDHGHSED
jgi:two-component system, NarL family, sensor histidine kinase UhpB